MDRFTPCVSSPTESHARRRKNIDHPRAGCHETVLRHFSCFLDQQESRITRLMRNFDIDFEDDVSCDRRCITDLEECSFSGLFDNMATSSFSKLPPAPQSDKARSTWPTAVSRPGRLSPSTIQMILSSNTSTVSGISSAADTSYDSGLYQWLGVQTDTALRTSPSLPVMSSKALNDSANLDISIVSSGSAYSQPSLEPQVVLPLSPPATTIPPFSDTLREEPTADMLQRIPDLLPHHMVSTESNQIYLRDFTTPMLSNNLSLQHYMPSVLVLRHFQKVIDELRGLYVPNDTGNNTPNPDRRRVFLSSCRSLPCSYMKSPCGVSRPRSPYNPSNSATQVQNTASPAPTMARNTYRGSRTTPELYTEMAVMLFSQVSKEEAQVTNLQNLVNRLEALAVKKRKVALVIGRWGRERGGATT